MIDAMYFPFDEVLELAAFNLAHNQGAAYGDLFDDDLYPGGKVITKDGGNWPDESMIDQGKLNNNRALHLVGDHGVCLMAGTVETMPAKEGAKVPNYVVYAQGCNPEHDEFFYENKVDLFGGDDGVERISLSTICTMEGALKARSKSPSDNLLKIRFEGDSMLIAVVAKR